MNTRSFVLILDDPDAPNGTFTRWVLFDIPKAVQTLDAGQPAVGIAAIKERCAITSSRGHSSRAVTSGMSAARRRNRRFR